MFRNASLTVLILCAFSFYMPATTASSQGWDQAAAVVAQSDMAQGEVRRIDKENKKITLRHGEIKNLNMPPMSMVFQVRDPALLDKVLIGDKVRFRAVEEDGTLVITEMEKDF